MPTSIAKVSRFQSPTSADVTDSEHFSKIACERADFHNFKPRLTQYIADILPGTFSYPFGLGAQIGSCAFKKVKSSSYTSFLNPNMA